MGEASDATVIKTDIPQDWLDYLQATGIDTYAITSGISERMNAVPWGWDQDAISTFHNFNANFSAPNLSIVKKVNSRRFSNELSVKYGFGVPRSIFCDDIDCFLKTIDSFIEYPLVVKPVFGGSGFGFRFFHTPDEGKTLIDDIQYLLNHGGVIVEPWHQRIYDLSSTVIISQNGHLSPIRHQRFFSNDFGTFYAIYISPDDKAIDINKEQQERAVFLAAQELSRHGYFGTAGFDSFVYRTSSGKETLAAVIEINARHSMSDIAHAIRNRYAKNRFCFFRLISKKRCSLPDNYHNLNKLLSPVHFNPLTMEGVILLSPLRFCHNGLRIKPSKNALFLAAKSEEDLFNLDLKVRNLIEKKSR